MKLPPPNPSAVLRHFRAYTKAANDELAHQRLPTPASMLRSNDDWAGKLPAPEVVCTLLRTLSTNHLNDLQNSPVSVRELFSKLLSGPWEGSVEQQMADALLLLRPFGPAPECEETTQLCAEAKRVSQLTAWVAEQTWLRLIKGQDMLHAGTEPGGAQAGGNLFPLYYGLMVELDRAVALSSDLSAWKRWTSVVPSSWEDFLGKGAPDSASVRALLAEAERMTLPVSLDTYARVMSHPAMTSFNPQIWVMTFRNIFRADGKPASVDEQRSEVQACADARNNRNLVDSTAKPSPQVYPHVENGKPVWRSLCLQAPDGPLVREKRDGTQLWHPYLYALLRHQGKKVSQRTHVVHGDVSPAHSGWDDFESFGAEQARARATSQAGILSVEPGPTYAQNEEIIEAFRTTYHTDVKHSANLFLETSGLFPALNFLPAKPKDSYQGALEYHLYTVLYNITRGHADKSVRERAVRSALSLPTYTDVDSLLTLARGVELLAKDVGYWDVIPAAFLDSMRHAQKCVLAEAESKVAAKPPMTKAPWLPLSLEPLSSQGKILLEARAKTRYIHPWTYALALRTLPDPSVLFEKENVLDEVAPLDHRALSWDAHRTTTVPEGTHGHNFQRSLSNIQELLKGSAFREECLAQNKETDWRFATWIMPNEHQSTEHKLRIMLYQLVYRLSHLNVGWNLSHDAKRLLATITKGTIQELVASCVDITYLLQKEDFPLDVPDAYGDAVANLIAKLQEETTPVVEKSETQPRMNTWLDFSVAIPERAYSCAEGNIRNTFLHPWLYALALKRLGPQAARLLVAARSQHDVPQRWSRDPSLPRQAFLWTPPFAELKVQATVETVEDESLEALKPAETDSADWRAFVLEADGLDARRDQDNIQYDPNTEWSVLPVPPGGPKISATDHLRVLAYQLAFQILHSELEGQPYVDILRFRDRILDPSLSVRDIMQDILLTLRRCGDEFHFEFPAAYMTALEKLAAELHLTQEAPAEKNAALNIRVSRAEAILQSFSKSVTTPNVTVQGEAVVADYRTHRSDSLNASVPAAHKEIVPPVRGTMWQSMYPALGSELCHEMPWQSVRLVHPWLLAAAHMAGFSLVTIYKLMYEETALHWGSRAQFSSYYLSAGLLQQLHSLAESHEKVPEGKDPSIYRKNLVDRFKAAVSKLDRFSAGDGEDTPWLGDDVAFAARQWFVAKCKRDEPVFVDDMLDFYGCTLLFQLAYWSRVPTEEIAHVWSEDRRLYGRHLVQASLRLAGEHHFMIPDSILATLQHLLLRDGSSPMDENYIQSGSDILLPLPAPMDSLHRITEALAGKRAELTWTWDETQVTISAKNGSPFIACSRSSLKPFKEGGITYTVDIPREMEGSSAGSVTMTFAGDKHSPAPIPTQDTDDRLAEAAPVKEERKETTQARPLDVLRNSMTISYDSTDGAYAVTPAGTRAQFALRHENFNRDVLHALDLEENRWVSLLTSNSVWEPAHPYTFDLFHLAMNRLHKESPRSAAQLVGYGWSSEILRLALDGGSNFVGARSTSRPWDGGASLIAAVNRRAAKEEAEFKETVPTGTSKGNFQQRVNALNTFRALLHKVRDEAVGRLQSESDPLHSLNDAKDIGVDGTAWSLTYHAAHRVVLELQRTRGTSLHRALDSLRMTYWRSDTPECHLREVLTIARNERIQIPEYLLLNLLDHVESHPKVWAENEGESENLRKVLSTYPYRTKDSGYGLITKGMTMTDKMASEDTNAESRIRAAAEKAHRRLKRAIDDEEDDTKGDNGFTVAFADSEDSPDPRSHRKRSISASELTMLMERAAQAKFTARFKRFVNDGLNSEDPEEREMAKEIVKSMKRGAQKYAQEDMEIELADEDEEAKRPWYMPSEELVDDVKGYGISGVVRLTREEAIGMIRSPVLSFLQKESGGGATGKMVKAMGAHFFREGGKLGEAVLSATAGLGIPLAIETFSPEDQKMLRKASGALRKEFFEHASHMLLGSVWKEIKEPLKEALVPLLSKMKEAATTVNAAKGALGAAKTRIDVREASRDEDVHEEVPRGRSTADRRAHKRD